MPQPEHDEILRRTGVAIGVTLEVTTRDKNLIKSVTTMLGNEA